MALSGVRSSWLILARNFDLAWLASSARVFSSAYFSARSASSSACVRASAASARRSARRHQALLALHQLFFVPLERGDVGADRDEAAILGAPLADVQPAAVVELRLEGARARASAVARDLRADHRLAPGRDHRLVGGAGGDRASGRLWSSWKFELHSTSRFSRVPQHEGFRDGLDRVAQAHVGLDGALDEILLLGDVDGDADEMRPGSPGWLRELAARPQPHPMAVGVAHAEIVIDRRCVWRRQAGRQARRDRCRRDGRAR